MLTAMKDADMPASQINLTWTGPDNAGSAVVTGYIIERAYGDVMFLNRDEDGATGNKIVAHPGLRLLRPHGVVGDPELRGNAQCRGQRC